MTGLMLLASGCLAQPARSKTDSVMPGAARTDIYLPMLKGKRVGVFANTTSRIGRTHLVDTLLRRGVQVVRIFGPEHGFRGTADAGELVKDGLDPKSGLPVISLYGDHRKPTPADLKGLDLLIFDIQDVGVRFYTYISTLQYVLEAALENDIELMILDRPNPNGFYVDGPVLEPAFKSFVGMQPIPVVHGMTICEYAMMLMGERWLSEKANRKLDEREKTWGKSMPMVRNVDTYFGANISPKASPAPSLPKVTYIIPCIRYTHAYQYVLPVNPSPNLREMQSIYWYPSTCFFEGTVISEGRGTDKPFQIFGHPQLPRHLFAFKPQPNEGAKSSKCFYQTCYGWNLSGSVEQVLSKVNGRLQLGYLLEAYRLFPGKDSFFLPNRFFHKLAGNDMLMRQIQEGKTEAEIRESWQPGLKSFLNIRKKYLLYPDFN